MTAELFVITTPRDLALPGRLLRSLLGGIDRVNPFLAASQPTELEFDAIDRLGQVAGFSAMRDAMSEGMNEARLIRWSKRYRSHSIEPWQHFFGAAPSMSRAVPFTLRAESPTPTNPILHFKPRGVPG